MRTMAAKYAASRARARGETSSRSRSIQAPRVNRWSRTWPRARGNRWRVPPHRRLPRSVKSHTEWGKWCHPCTGNPREGARGTWSIPLREAPGPRGRETRGERDSRHRRVSPVTPRPPRQDRPVSRKGIQRSGIRVRSHENPPRIHLALPEGRHGGGIGRGMRRCRTGTGP